jgi:hypothetical protein
MNDRLEYRRCIHGALGRLVVCGVICDKVERALQAKEKHGTRFAAHAVNCISA